MEKKKALACLSALGHEGRLDIFRLLVKAGQGGLVAGEISVELGLLPNSLSTQLGILAHCGLARAEREGRNIRYRAEMAVMREVLSYLMEDCCGGNPALCAPLLEKLACGC
jgi:DNA-binding transcriptional ArsR family regulator